MKKVWNSLLESIRKYFSFWFKWTMFLLVTNTQLCWNTSWEERKNLLKVNRKKFNGFSFKKFRSFSNIMTPIKSKIQKKKQTFERNLKKVDASEMVQQVVLTNLLYEIVIRIVLEFMSVCLSVCMSVHKTLQLLLSDC